MATGIPIAIPILGFEPFEALVPCVKRLLPKFIWDELGFDEDADEVVVDDEVIVETVVSGLAALPANVIPLSPFTGIDVWILKSNTPLTIAVWVDVNVEVIVVESSVIIVVVMIYWSSISLERPR